jgi:cytochrome c2
MRGARLFAAAAGVFAAGAAIAQAPAATVKGDPAAGENLFLDQCASCHVPEGGGQGPSLKGVWGRRAAAVPDFPYSAALKGSGLTWTGPTLDHFLTNPGMAVPGTAMPLVVADPKDRADLIAYFAAQR